MGVEMQVPQGQALHIPWSFSSLRVAIAASGYVLLASGSAQLAEPLCPGERDSVVLQAGTIRRVNHTTPNAWHTHESLFCCHVLQFLPVLQYLGVCCPCDLPTAL